MPMAAIKFVPGVNVEKTLSANEAGISQSQLIRYKDQMVQTMGGWDSYPLTSPSTVKDLHPWQDVQGRQWLSAAATMNVTAESASVGSQDITPQTRTTNPTPSFSISSGDNVVTVRDPDSAPTVYNTVFFNTPVSVGSQLLSGAYKIQSVLSTGIYTIIAEDHSDVTVSSGGILPIFDTSSGSPFITVTLPNNGFQDITGLNYSFYAPTTVDGQTVSGAYEVASIIDSTQFTIGSNILSSATDTATMNSGLAQLVYYVNIGPQASGSGFGANGFGDGGFGTGEIINAEPGDPITADNWSQDNWGEILLACPLNGPIYQWSPEGGLPNMQVVTTAPFFNGGIFISQPQQILVAWRSTQSTGTQDNLIVNWSDAGDYTNWVISNDTSAGRFRIPSGSIIVGGLQAPTRGVIWTDIEVWIMQYVGGDVIFNFTKVGTGCGLIAQHACGVINGGVFWMGQSNFFTLGQDGATPIPCTVWDFVFQNLNLDEADKIICAPNSAFNEIAWFFPSLNSGSGDAQNDSYVKLNLVENEWDYGTLQRTAWTDISVLGNPIGADPQGLTWQHEEGEMQTGAPITSFRSGWWALSEGQEMIFVDFIIPDFKWSLYSGSEDAQINITFYSVNYPGETPITYGPYTVTKGTEFISVRLRGRLMSVFIQSNNSVFWRIGQIRYRFATSGRR